MSQILGTLLDSGGNPLSGKLRVTLTGNVIEVSPNPDAIYIPEPSLITITNGVIDITLEETETKKVTYRFEFFKVDIDGNLIEPALLDFYALVPNVSPVQFASLVPTGMVNDLLDTGALRIARIIADDPNLASAIGGPFPRGEWLAGTTYKFRDLVTYLSRTYISKSITPLTGVLPTDTNNWMNIPVEPDGNLILGDATPYGVSWNGSGLAPSQDAVYDAVESLNSNISSRAPLNAPNFTGNITTTGIITALTNKSLVNYGSFTVGGDSSNYYPVRFAFNPLHFSTKQKLQIYRPNVHDNGSASGSFHLEFAFQPTNYGNIPTVIEIINYQVGYGNFFGDPVGDIVDGSNANGTGNDVIVWLKGAATYYWRSPESSSFWTLINGNAAGGNISDSSGFTHLPRNTQTNLILSAKGWIDITPINGWSNYGGGLTPLRARKANGFVEVRGTLLRSDSALALNTVGILPSGYAPIHPLITTQAVNTPSGYTTARVDITGAGELKVMAYASGTTLESLSINQVFSNI